MKDIFDAYAKMGTCPYIRDEDRPERTIPVRDHNNNFTKAKAGKLTEAGQGTAIYDNSGKPIAGDTIHESDISSMEFGTFATPKLKFMLELASGHAGKAAAAQAHFASIAENSYSLNITSKANDKSKRINLVAEGDEANLARFARDLKALNSLASVRIVK